MKQSVNIKDYFLNQFMILFGLIYVCLKLYTLNHNNSHLNLFLS